MRLKSRDLPSGSRLRHKNGKVVTLERRKTSSDARSNLPYHPGWWLDTGAGLADFIVDDPESEWKLLDMPRVRGAG